MRTASLNVGQYYPADSPVHRLDPRPKILVTLVLAVVVFSVYDYRALLLVAGLIVITVGVARLPWSWVLRSLRPLTVILVFTFLLHLLATGGPALLRLGPLTFSRQGLGSGLFVVARLLLLVLSTSLLTLTTSPIQLTDGLESLMKPLSVVRFPSHELAMMMAIALRFIPTLAVETDKLIKAQSSRGADFETGNPVRRARAFMPLLIPLFIAVFRRADELALAMEARCYRGGAGRTRMRQLHMAPVDWFTLAGLLAMMALAVVVGR